MPFKKLCLLIVLSICLQVNGQSPTPLSRIAEKTKNMRKMEGYFNFWIDDTNGKIWLLVDKFDQEFLYVNSLPAGLGSNDIGLDRGLIGDSRIVYFNRVGKKIFLIQPNYNYRAVTADTNEQKAVRQSFAQSIIGNFMVDEEEGNKVLVDATGFLVRDAPGVADRLRGMKQGSYNFSEARSAIYLSGTKNFPLNSEFEATISFTGGADAGKFLSNVTPSTEAFTLRVHHSFVQLPDHQYHPRKYDIRSGFNATSYFDYSTPFTEPIEQLFIHRHRIQKKNPEAARSEPIQPIVYYLDNGTPEPIRSALLDGARWWNQAFEAAGFIGGFIVKILPDSADPMDIRYNMINWVHRSTRGWSYGASITDPRTGEIIKGQVTLGSLRVRQDYLIFSGLLAPAETGTTASETLKAAALQRLRQLAAHEVGHTLGLQHNYASSYNNRASVMDYPHPNIQLDKQGKIDFSDIYTHEIGEWDKRAIMFGYSDFAPGTNEPQALNRLLEENTQKGLLFIADLDARAAGGLHPYAHLWDNGKDASDGLKQVLAVRGKALENFSENNIATGTPMSKLEDVLVPIYNYHRYQLEAVCKLIGGMNYSYNVRGDQQVKPTILSKAIQEKALKAALDCLSPDLLLIPERITNLIPPRPPKYYEIGELFQKRTGMSFDPLAAAEALTNFELAFLFHPERTNRLIQFKAQTGTPGWDDVLDAILQKTWKSPSEKGLKQEIKLQTDQMVLSYLLSLSMNEAANYQVRAICFDRLQSLKAFAAEQAKQNPALRAHYLYAIERINKPKDTVIPAAKAIAPGAPIGMEDDY